VTEKKSKWTVSEATKVLGSNVTNTAPNVWKVTSPLSLRQCGALDFLRNHIKQTAESV
jgi:hypothetical protein